MNYVLRAFFNSLVLAVLIVAWQLDPATAQLRDLLFVLHSKAFLGIVTVLTVALLQLDWLLTGKLGRVVERIVRPGRGSDQKLAAVYSITSRPGRGIHKRIDENRELLELLQKEEPQLLERAPWVEHWLLSHDHFFTELAELVQVERPVSRTKPYPRPWPMGSRPEKTSTMG